MILLLVINAVLFCVARTSSAALEEGAAEAYAEFKASGAEQADGAFRHLVLGLRHMSDQDLRTAEREFVAASEFATGTTVAAPAELARGYLHLLQHDRRAAMDAFGRAAEWGSGATAVRAEVALGRMAVQSDDYARAGEAVDRALLHFPNDNEQLAEIAEFRNNGHYVVALDGLDRETKNSDYWKPDLTEMPDRGPPEPGKRVAYFQAHLARLSSANHSALRAVLGAANRTGALAVLEHGHHDHDHDHEGHSHHDDAGHQTTPVVDAVLEQAPVPRAHVELSPTTIQETPQLKDEGPGDHSRPPRTLLLAATGLSLLVLFIGFRVLRSGHGNNRNQS